MIPDLVVSGGPSEPVVVDAKYKGRAESGAIRIADADVYEALAFGRASNLKRIVLLYPRVPTSQAAGEAGSTEATEVVKVDDTRIVGLAVEVRGLAKRSGLRSFAANLGAGVMAAAR